MRGPNRIPFDRHPLAMLLGAYRGRGGPRSHIRPRAGRGVPLAL